MERAGEDFASANAADVRDRVGTGAPEWEELEWLRCFVEIAPVGIFRADSEGRCIYVSERWTKLSGFTPEMALGFGWEKSIHPEDIPLIRAEWERSQREQVPFNLEFRYLQPNGKIVWVLAQTVGHRHPRGEGMEYVCTVTDVSELRRMREELQRSHEVLEERVRERTAELEHMAMIVAASSHAIVSSDLEGRIVSWNQTAEKIFGYSAREMIGQTSFRVTPADRLEEARMLKARALRGDRIEGFETVRVARSGELIEVILSLFPLRDAEGKIAGTSAVVRDMREQKKAERRLHQLSGRLLRVQDEERRRLARELHDSTAQSLAALALNVSLLHSRSAQQSEEKRASLVADGLALVETIGRDLRTHAYLLHPPLLDERGLKSALRWLVEGYTARSGVAVELEIAPDLQRLPERMELTIFRVVQEGLTNIHRHAKSPTASICLRLDQHAIVVHIRDAGRGIPKNGEDSIGVGIGGMRERLAQIGGFLEIESSPRGTTVTASIPRV